MCARKSKSKKNDHTYSDCITCLEQNDEGINTSESVVELANTDQLLELNDSQDRAQRIILCPQILKVADKVVDAGEQPSSCCIKSNYNFRDSGEIHSRYLGNIETNRDDAEELRRKAFRMYKQYLDQKKAKEECPPLVYVCPPQGELKGNAVGPQPRCYNVSYNIFLVIVFMILFVMLVCTTGFIYVVLQTDVLKDVFHEYWLYLSVPALILLIIMNYTMTCSQCARVLPCNFMYLLFAVVCTSILAAVVTVLLNTTIVMLVYGTITVVVFFFILLAYSRFDFTKWILYMIAIFLALCSVWILHVLCTKYMHVRYGPFQLFAVVVIAVVNVVILVIELQMILEGRSLDLDESDYALGAFLLYTSIIELCMSLVQATGILEENESNG